jgi:trigger factor
VDKTVGVRLPPLAYVSGVTGPIFPNSDKGFALITTQDLADYMTELETTGENTVRLKISVAPEVVSARLDAEYLRCAREIKMPGFRKGKVPRRVIESRYGKSILDDVVGDIVAETLDAAIREKELNVIGKPTVNIEPYEGTDGIIYSADVDVYPDIKLTDIEPILGKIKTRKPKVTDKDVESAVDNLRTVNATLEPVTERPSEDGDLVIVRFLAETPPGFNSNTVRIWANKNPDDFAGRQVVGHITGDTFSLIIKYPGDFGDTTVAGTERKEPVEVAEIKTPVPPELDDDFAADLGFDDLQALKADVRRNLLRRDAARARTEAFEKLISTIAGEVTVPMSESFIEKAAVDAYGVSSLEELDTVRKEEALIKTRNGLKEYIITRRLADEKGINPEREEVEAFRRKVTEAEGIQISYAAAYDHISKRKLTELLFGGTDDSNDKKINDVAKPTIENKTEN